LSANKNKCALEYRTIATNNYCLLQRAYKVAAMLKFASGVMRCAALREISKLSSNISRNRLEVKSRGLRCNRNIIRLSPAISFRQLSTSAPASSGPLDEEGLVLKFFATAKRNDEAGIEDLTESEEFMQIKDTINLTDSFGNSPLMIAAQRNWSDTITLLLNNEHCNVNHQNFFGSSALMCSASHGHLDALKVLCASDRVEIDLLSRFGQTALMKAAQAGKLESIKILIEHGARADTVNKQGKDAIAIAAEKGHAHVVEYLTSLGAKN
jgi:ankyrin repeat protein